MGGLVVSCQFNHGYLASVSIMSLSVKPGMENLGKGQVSEWMGLLSKHYRQGNNNLRKDGRRETDLARSS